MEGDAAAAALTPAPRLLGVEMIVPRRTRDYLSLSRYAQALHV